MSFTLENRRGGYLENTTRDSLAVGLSHFHSVRRRRVLDDRVYMYSIRYTYTESKDPDWAIHMHVAKRKPNAVSPWKPESESVYDLQNQMTLSPWYPMSLRSC